MSKYSEQVRNGAAMSASYIRKYGWLQGQTGKENGPCCMMGATGYACPLFDWKVDQAVREELREMGMTSGIAHFNDTPGRTKEEVLAVFDRIANS